MKEFNRVTSAQSEVEPMFIFEVGSLNVFKMFKCWIFVPECISYHQEGKIQQKSTWNCFFCGTGSSFRLVLLTDPSDLWTQWWLCHFWKRCDQFAAKLFVLDSRLKSSVGSDFITIRHTFLTVSTTKAPSVKLMALLSQHILSSQCKCVIITGWKASVFHALPNSHNHVTAEERERCRPQQ